MTSTQLSSDALLFRKLAVPLLVLWAGALPAQVGIGRPPGEVLEVEELLLDASVTDRQGQPLVGLVAADFEVLEDGKPLVVLAVSPGGGEAPRGQVPDSAGSPPVAAAARDFLHVVLFFDQPHLGPHSRARAIIAARRFVAESLSAEDEVMVATAAPDLRLLNTFSSNRDVVLASFDAVERSSPTGHSTESGRRHALETLLKIREINVAAGDPPCLLNILDPVRAHADSVRRDAESTLAALDELVSLLAAIPGRKALIYVTDGIPLRGGDDLFQVLFELCGPGQGTSGVTAPGGRRGGTTPQLENVPGTFSGSHAALEAEHYSVNRSLAAVTARANAHRVTFFPLQASGLAGGASEAVSFGAQERLLQLSSVANTAVANLRDPLAALSSDTGGRALFNSNDLAGLLARVPADLRGSYTLVVEPRHPGEGRTHRLEVRAAKASNVRYAHSYRHQTWLERAHDRTRSILAGGQEDNGLGVEVLVSPGPQQLAGPGTLIAHVRVPFRQLTLPLLKEGAYGGRLRVFVAVQRDTSSLSAVRGRQLTVRIPVEQAMETLDNFWVYQVQFEQPSSDQRIAIGVIDELSRLASYVSVPLAAPPLRQP